MSPDSNPGKRIETAIQQGLEGEVRALLGNVVDINAPCDPQRYGSVSPLMTALRAGQAGIVRLIASLPPFDLSRSLSPFETWSWVRGASLATLIEYLYIHGSDVNRKDGNGKTLLHEAVYDLGGQDKIREILARREVAIDAQRNDNTTPLYHAGVAGNLEAFQLLLGRGADSNNRNNDNLWTILMCAAAKDRSEIAELLLRRSEIEVNARDDLRNTALHIAAGRGHAGIVALLLQRPDIDVNPKDHMGWTPLAKAAFAGHAETVMRLLVRPDIEVNFVDQDRQTPLFHAASSGRIEVARLLLADGLINPSIRNQRDGLTARDMALALGHKEIADLLEQHPGGEDRLSPNDSYQERKAAGPPAFNNEPPFKRKR